MSGRTQSEESSSCCDRVSKTWSKVNERSFPSTSCGWFFTLKRQTLSCGSSGSSGRTRTATRTEVSSRGEEETYRRSGRGPSSRKAWALSELRRG